MLCRTKNWRGGGKEKVSFLPVGETFEKKNSNTLKLFSADLSKKGIQPTAEGGHYKDITKPTIQ